MEYRNTPVATPYNIDSDDATGYRIEIQDNLYIIGTMNTADKSIGTIDYALRRRFLFFLILPNCGVILSSVNNNENAIEIKLFDLIQNLFDECLSEDFHKDDVQIGHTYFLRKNCDSNLNKVINQDNYNIDELKEYLYKVQMRTRFIYQVIPILCEYYKDGVIDRSFKGKDDCTRVLINWYQSNEIDDIEKIQPKDLLNAGYEEIDKSKDDQINIAKHLLSIWKENKHIYMNDIYFCLLYKMLNNQDEAEEDK